MLIIGKVTKDKRIVTDLSHLNVRIAKNNLACPLCKDTFLVLGGCLFVDAHWLGLAGYAYYCVCAYTLEDGLF